MPAIVHSGAGPAVKLHTDTCTGQRACADAAPRQYRRPHPTPSDRIHAHQAARRRRRRQHQPPHRRHAPTPAPTPCSRPPSTARLHRPPCHRPPAPDTRADTHTARPRDEDLQDRLHPRRRHRQGSGARRPGRCWRRWRDAHCGLPLRVHRTSAGAATGTAQHGAMMPADGLDALRGMDAILFGSAGDPHIPDHVTLWGLRLKICQGFDQYANVRPTRILPGIDAPLKRCSAEDLDWVIVRENSEGEYAGVGGRVAPGPSDRGRDRRVDHDARRRRADHALRLRARAVAAAQAAHGRHQVQRAAPRDGDVGRDRACRSADEFPDVRWDKELVDAAPRAWSTGRRRSTPLVATNLHADILSDLAAALAGSLGIAPTGNIDPERRYPSHVRADPRLGLRHHGQGHGQSGRHVLELRDAARASGRDRRGGAADGGDRGGHGESGTAHARPRRHRHHGASDRMRCARSLANPAAPMHRAA